MQTCALLVTKLHIQETEPIRLSLTLVLADCPESASAGAAGAAAARAAQGKTPKAKRAPGVTAEQEYKSAKAAAKLLRRQQWEQQQAAESRGDAAAAAGGGSGERVPCVVALCCTASAIQFDVCKRNMWSGPVSAAAHSLWTCMILLL